jgi:hypothetical protein
VSGARGDDDSGRRPPDPEGLPGFPAEWGRIVIPDDASELAREAAKVRRELRRDALLRRYGLHPRHRLRHLALPVILVIMAVLVTTTSLFAAMWPQGQRQSGRQSGNPATTSPAELQTGKLLPDLALASSTGKPVRLRDSHPAVILLTRQCDCTGLISGTVRSAEPAKVSVLVVGSPRKCARDQPHRPVRLVEPCGRRGHHGQSRPRQRRSTSGGSQGKAGQDSADHPFRRRLRQTGAGPGIVTTGAQRRRSGTARSRTP